MIKRILVALLLAPLIAFAQSYPSPTYQNLTVLGTLTATGIGPGSLAAQAANTVLANVTASSASPTAVAIPSCSTANSALKYTSGTGLSCGTTFGLTSGNLSQFASTTSAQLAGIVSDETGSGSLVFGTSPTINTPTINGVTNGSAAGSGVVGQTIVQTGTGVSMTTNVITTLTSVSIPAGVWLIQGNIDVSNTAGNLTLVDGWLSTSSGAGSQPAKPGYAFFSTGTSGQTEFAFNVPTILLNVTSSTTVFLSGACVFASGTTTGAGTITALRIH